MDHQYGVMIERGAQDWQIFQQKPDGTATISLSGTWTVATPFQCAAVLVRLMREDEMEPLSPAFDYRTARTESDGTWSIVLNDVPAGGLYRIETSLQIDDGPVEWALRGDMVHHIGVGDIWVIAGQSNAVGYGKSPVHDAPELGIHLFHARGRWTIASHPFGDSTGTKYPLNREKGNASHSPYLSFGRKMKHLLGYPIGLIPAALGASPISRWVRSINGDLFPRCSITFAMPGDPAAVCCGIRDVLTPILGCTTITLNGFAQWLKIFAVR